MACGCNNNRGGMDDASIDALFSLVKQTPNENGEISLLATDDPFVSALAEIIAEKAQYLNETGLEYLIMRLRQRFIERIPDKGLSSNDFTDGLKDKLDKLPDNDTLQNMINTINSATWLVVDKLPAEGKAGTIYLVPLSTTTTGNNYSEYIYIKETQQWELLGIFGITGSGLVTEIGVNTNTFKPNINGRVVLDPMLVELICNDHAFFVDAHGRIDLGNIAGLGGVSGVIIGDQTLGPNADGMVDLSATLQGLIGTINSANWLVVDKLPNTGKAGTIYLVPLSTTQSNNQFAEYIFVKETQQWELLGAFGITGSGLVTEIGVNTNTFKPNVNGRVVLDPMLVELICNDHAFFVDAHGRIDLGNIGALGGVGGIIIGDNTYTPDKDGLIDLSGPLGALVSSGLVKKITMNGTTYSPNSSGIVALGNVATKISYGGTTYTVNSSGLITLPGTSGDYLPLTGGTMTGNIRLKTGNANYGSKLNFGDGEYVYLHEDTDDHLKIYASGGIDLGPKVTINGEDISNLYLKLTGGYLTGNVVMGNSSDVYTYFMFGDASTYYSWIAASVSSSNNQTHWLNIHGGPIRLEATEAIGTNASHFQWVLGTDAPSRRADYLKRIAIWSGSNSSYTLYNIILDLLSAEGYVKGSSGSSTSSNITITMNGSSKEPSSSGVIALGGVCTKITLNGSTYSVSSSGTINLGTITSGSGGTTTVVKDQIYTGTTVPATSLGSDGDFYYRFT